LARGVSPQRAPELHVVGDDPERGLETLARVFGVGRRGADLGHTRVGVDFRGWNRRAQGGMTNHAVHAAIGQVGHFGIAAMSGKSMMAQDLHAVASDNICTGGSLLSGAFIPDRLPLITAFGL